MPPAQQMQPMMPQQQQARPFDEDTFRQWLQDYLDQRLNPDMGREQARGSIRATESREARIRDAGQRVAARRERENRVSSFTDRGA